MKFPKICDDDCDTITAEMDGKSIRSWHYTDEPGRRLRMHKAHEFAEGWFQAMKSLNAEQE